MARPPLFDEIYSRVTSPPPSPPRERVWPVVTPAPDGLTVEEMFPRLPVKPHEPASDDDSVYAIDALPPPRKRVIYIIRSGDYGPVKIGTAINLKARLSILQIGSPYDLQVLAWMPGNMSDESHLHRRFASARERGEWFTLTPELVTFIRELQAELRAAPNK